MRDATSAQELLAMVQRLQKEADARNARSPTRGDVRPDLTVAIGEEVGPGANQGSARESSVFYAPPSPAAKVSDTQTLHILGACMVRGWTRGAQSVSPPSPVGTGSLIDGGFGNFTGLIR